MDGNKDVGPGSELTHVDPGLQLLPVGGIAAIDINIAVTGHDHPRPGSLQQGLDLL